MGLRLNTPWRVVSHAGDLMKRQHRLSSRSARRSSLPGYGAENARSSRGRSTPSPSMGVRSAGRVTALASRGVPRRLVPRAHAAPSCDRFGLTKTKKGQGEDPVARLQEAARWSTYQLVVAAPGTGPPPLGPPDNHRGVCGHGRRRARRRPHRIAHPPLVNDVDYR
jgi:hypothetical protein